MADKTLTNPDNWVSVERLNQYHDNSLEEMGDLLDGKQGAFQFSEIPTATAGNLGAIIQYTGSTTASYTNGYFYKCVEKSGAYEWENVEVQSSSGGGSDEYVKKSGDTMTGGLTTTNITVGSRTSGTVGGNSAVIGTNNKATESNTVAVGYATEATKFASFASGHTTKATGQGSFSQGQGTTASGDYSHAEGYYTTAGYTRQHVEGKYNANKSTNAFEIGNGTSASARSNALEVDWDGNLTASGDVTDGSGNKLSEKANKSALATVATSGKYSDLTGTPTITDTKNTAGSTDTSSKLFLIGATSQATNPQTYSHDTAYVGTDGHLYSNSKQAVNLSDSQALTNKTYNGYSLGSACAKGVTDSSSASVISTGTSLPTERDIYYGLPNINGSHTYDSNTNIYAPTSAGTSGQVLKSNGSGAPSWADDSGAELDYLKVTTNSSSPIAASANPNNSIAIGYNSNAAGSNSVCIGVDATTNHYTAIAIGSQTISQGDSIAIGTRALGGYYGGQYEIHRTGIGIGYMANGCCQYSIAIGYRANAPYVYGSTSQICIGNYSYVSSRLGDSLAVGSNTNTTGSYSTAIGCNATVSSDKTLQLGDNNNLSSLKCKVSLTVTSDIRDKTDIKPIDNALEFISKLKPITFVSNMRSLYDYDYKETVIDENGNETIVDNNPYKEYGFTPYDKEEHAKGTKKGTRRRAGLSAQEVYQALLDIYGTDNYANLVNSDMYDRENIPDEVESHLGVQYEVFVPFLIKAIQELSAKVEALENR